MSGEDRKLLASPVAAARVVLCANRQPGPDDIQLRVLRAGLCGTDVQIATGRRPDTASVLGHEGLVLLGHAEGPPVIPNPVHPHNQDEILGHSYDGLFQDRLTVRKLDRGGPELCPAAPELVADLAPVVEPLGTVLYSNELLAAGASPRSLLIVGGGTTAVLHALVATRQGIEVHLVHHRAARLRWLAAHRLVGDARLHIAGRDLAARVRATAARGPLDAAILCVPREGAQEALGHALACVRMDGIINLFGGFRCGDEHPHLPGIDLGAIRRANVRGVSGKGGSLLVETRTGETVRLTGHRGTSLAHLIEAQRQIVETPEVFAPVVTEVVSLEGLAALLRKIRTKHAKSEAEHCKIVVDLTVRSGRGRVVDLTRRIADVE